MLQCSLMRAAAGAAAGAAALLAGATPARADWDGRGGLRDHRYERPWHGPRWGVRPYVYAPPPPVYYAPPPVYYPPPPPRYYAPRYYAPPPVYFGFGIR